MTFCLQPVSLTIDPLDFSMDTIHGATPHPTNIYMQVHALKSADFVKDVFHNLPPCVTEALRAAFGLVWRALRSLGRGKLPGLCYVPLSSIAVKSLEKSRSESKAEHFSSQSTVFLVFFRTRL